MIYDAELVSNLIVRYQRGEYEVLDEILLESKSLVEVIASKFGATHWEDLVNECMLKISKAINSYDPELASAHAYFTSVITNCCNTYMGKQHKQALICDELGLNALNGRQYQNPPTISKEPLYMLKMRNRKRFPSIDVNTIDAVSEHIYFCLVEGVKGKSRAAAKEIETIHNINKKNAHIIYQSSVIFLRSHFVDNIIPTDDSSDVCEEFSLLTDVKDLLGDKAFDNLTMILSGMFIKWP